MTTTPKDAYYFNIYKKFPNSLEDFWDSDSDPEAYNNEEFSIDSLFVSQSINYAVSEMNVIQEEFNLDPITDFNQILDNRALNIKFLLDLCQHYDAHSKKKLERTKFLFKTSNENNSSNELNINKASSLVSQLTRDDFVSTKSRENRWKLGRNTSNSIVRAKNTSAKFDNTFCVAQIIAMYERDTSIYLYINTPISDLKSLFYISLKIFFHINGAIFSALHDYQFYIFSHIEASHVVYHIASEDIRNNEEVEEILILKEQAKEILNSLKKY
ncbi:6963_t:CDS:2 [Dentiscutata erythropus]|uniref:6963_t:CDS:1 n=1 Tax=Dentiscutata erythropus TaxID=1348616 RepID=A0A9N9JB07_9GLOM|nr:6963_t:CDS:2 [Dentiscutata erythropus]